jgi:hypothetical protein
MIQKLIKHKLAANTKDFPKLISEIKKQFPEWEYKSMGVLKTMIGGMHYHISSKDKKEKGVVEITLAPELKGQMEIKVATNRMKEWSEDAVKKLVKWMKI